MKPIEKSFSWLAPRLRPEQREALVNQWTNEKLDAQDRDQKKREQKRHDEADTNLENEMDPGYLAAARQQGLRMTLPSAFAAAIKKRDIELLVKLTKLAGADDDVLRVAWREAVAPLPGRRRGRRKAGQRFIDDFEREFFDYMADIRDRVLEIWREHSVRGPARVVGVTAEAIAVERALGPKVQWPSTKDWPHGLEPKTWDMRRAELIKQLKNYLKTSKRPKRRL